MKRFLIAATAAAGLLAAASTASAANGDVVVSGSVAASCSALDASTISVGELATASGTVVATFNGTPSTTLSFRCNTPTSKFTITASPLLNAGTAPTGYTARVNYTATATPTLTTGAGTAVSCNTTTPTCPVTNPSGQGGYLAATTGNVAVAVSAPSTTAGALLIAGAYQGTITVSIAPS